MEKFHEVSVRIASSKIATNQTVTLGKKWCCSFRTYSSHHLYNFFLKASHSSTKPSIHPLSKLLSLVRVMTQYAGGLSQGQLDFCLSSERLLQFWKASSVLKSLHKLMTQCWRHRLCALIWFVVVLCIHYSTGSLSLDDWFLSYCVSPYL